MDFGDSTIAGTFVGTMRTSITNGAGRVTGRLTVTVTSGTGDFAGKVGTGTFEQSEQISQPAPPPPSSSGDLPPGCNLPPGEPPPSEPPPGCVAPGDVPPVPPSDLPPECIPPPGEPPPSEPPPGCVPAGEPDPPSEPEPFAAVRVLSRAFKGSQMHLRLRSGKPTAAVAAPGRKLDRKRDGGLRVVAAPGAKCSALAQQGGKRVDVGRATDGNRDGLVVVTKKLLPKLGPGSWTIVATCSYRVGQTAGTATARSVTRV